MPLPLSLVLKAAEAMREDAIRNRRLRQETRVRLMMQAEAAPYRWLGSVMLERALAETRHD